MRPDGAAREPRHHTAREHATTGGARDVDAADADGSITFVWLTDWQVAEHRMLVEVGATVDWVLDRADATWLTSLFGDDRRIAWQVDTYGDGHDVRTTLAIAGVVLSLHGVYCPQVETPDGVAPQSGDARLQPVLDTSASWAITAPLPGRYDDGYLYGYVAAVEPMLRTADWPGLDG